MQERWPVGTMIARSFSGNNYTGSVTHILPATDEDEKLWHVRYHVDDDEEELDEEEMKAAHSLFENGVDHRDIDHNDSSSDDEYNPLE